MKILQITKNHLGRAIKAIKKDDELRLGAHCLLGQVFNDYLPEGYLIDVGITNFAISHEGCCLGTWDLPPMAQELVELFDGEQWVALDVMLPLPLTIDEPVVEEFLMNPREKSGSRESVRI